MTNPLYPPSRPIRFAEVRPEHVRPAVEAAMEDVRERIRKIVDGECGDLLQALDSMTLPLSEVMSVVGHLEGIATSEDLQAAYADVQGDVSEFSSSIVLNPALWAAVKAYAESEAGKAESGVRRRLLDQTVDDFVHGGAELPQDEKKRLSDIGVELSELCLKFSQNSLDATNAFEMYVDEPGMVGVPETAKAFMRDEARARGRDGYKAPSRDAVLDYAEDAGLRRAVYLADNARGTEEGLDNRPLMQRILELRREEAKLLGFQNFADYILSDRMAKNGQTAKDMMDRLAAMASDAFRRETSELQSYRDSLEGDGSEPVQMWDVRYYAERMKKDLLSFDPESVKGYFPFGSVLQGAFDLARSLYGVRMIPWVGPQVWDPSVLTYRMYDEDGTDLGGVYVDPYPRESKSDGAWCNGLVDGVGEPAVAVVALNCPPPSGGGPSLLTHMDVQTVFHEFGHCLHHMLSRTRFRSHFGMSVAWDFVELPSQVMENWTWDWDCLKTFARHWETGDPLPREMFERLLATRKFRGGTYMMQQIGYSSADLMLHTDYDPSTGEDVLTAAREFMQPYFPAPLTGPGRRIASFTHVFGDPVGYAAGYYSYKWAEILDADAFARFKELGHMSRAAGDAFRKSVLERGDEADPDVLYREFRGCDPDVKPLLENYGLL